MGKPSCFFSWTRYPSWYWNSSSPSYLWAEKGLFLISFLHVLCFQIKNRTRHRFSFRAGLQHYLFLSILWRSNSMSSLIQSPLLSLARVYHHLVTEFLVRPSLALFSQLSETKEWYHKLLMFTIDSSLRKGDDLCPQKGFDRSNERFSDMSSFQTLWVVVKSNPVAVLFVQTVPWGLSV